MKIKQVCIPYDGLRIIIILPRTVSKDVAVILNYNKGAKYLVNNCFSMLSGDYSPVSYYIKGRKRKEIDINLLLKVTSEVVEYVAKEFKQKITLVGYRYNFIVASLIAKGNKNILGIIGIDPVIDTIRGKEEAYSYLFDYLTKLHHRDLLTLMNIRPFPELVYSKKAANKEKVFNQLMNKHFHRRNPLLLFLDRFKQDSYPLLDSFFYTFSFFNLHSDLLTAVFLIIPSLGFHQASVCFFNQWQGECRQLYLVESRQIDDQKEVKFALQSIAADIQRLKHQDK